MRLGLMLGYSGGRPALAHSSDPRSGAARILRGLDGRSLWFRQRDAPGMDRRADPKDSPGHGYYADAGTDSGYDGHDGDDARPAIRRAHVAWNRLYPVPRSSKDGTDNHMANR